ncbi:MAG: hypothetical protein WDO19_22425 [Bacteroidota bacterium]
MLLFNCSYPLTAGIGLIYSRIRTSAKNTTDPGNRKKEDFLLI